MLRLALPHVLATAPLLRGLRLLGVGLMIGLIALAPLMALPTTTYAQNKLPGAPTHPVDLCKSGTFSACVTAVFYYLFVETTAIFAYFGGVVFDYVASIALSAGTYADRLINTGWTLARDLANMAFLFLVVFLGIRLILNIEGVGAGKTLAKIIAVALIINFSFFFTRVVIDASNVLARQFYDHINGRTAAASTQSTRGGQILVNGKPLEVKYISENIMGGLNVQQVLSTNSFKEQLKTGSFTGNIAILTGLFLLFGIINLILAFIFFAAAIQFIGRIVALWLTIMLAPIGFLAFIIPGMAKWSRTWWDTLIKNALFAPAFLFIFYLIVMFLDAGLLGAGTGQALYSTANTQSTSVDSFFAPLISIVIRLAIIIALLKAALKVGELFGQASAKSIIDGSLRYAGNAASFGLGGLRMMGRGMVAVGTVPATAAASPSDTTRPGRVSLPTLNIDRAPAPAAAAPASDTTPASRPSLNPLAATVTSGNQPLTQLTAARARNAANAAQSAAVAAVAESRPVSLASEAPTQTPAQQRASARLESAGRPNVFSERERSNGEIVNEIRNVTGKVEEVREALAPLKTLESSTAAAERPASSTSSIGTLDRLRDSVAAESAARASGSEAPQPERPEADILRNSALRDSLSQVEKATRTLSAAQQDRQTPPPAAAAAPTAPAPTNPRPPLSSAAEVETRREAPRGMQSGDITISQVEKLSQQALKEADRINRGATRALENLKRTLPPSASQTEQASPSQPTRTPRSGAEAPRSGAEAPREEEKPIL